MENITLYVDGSFLQDHGCGGFAAVPVLNNGQILIEQALVGSRASTGCQEMELIAVIHAIKSVPKDLTVTVYTDHKTICDVLSKPERARCEQGVNRNLWNQLRQICASRIVHLKWVKAHHDNMANCAADQLARNAAKQYSYNQSFIN